MSWVSFALALLKFVNAIIIWARERELISEGYDKAIFEEAKATLATTTEGKRLLEKINALSDGELDDLTDAVGNAGKGR